MILAAPAYVSANLLQTVYPELSALLEKITYQSLSVLHIACDQKRLMHIPPAFGFLVPGYRKKIIAGVLFNSSLFSDRSKDGVQLMTVFCHLNGRTSDHAILELANALNVHESDLAFALSPLDSSPAKI